MIFQNINWHQKFGEVLKNVVPHYYAEEYHFHAFLHVCIYANNNDYSLSCSNPTVRLSIRPQVCFFQPLNRSGPNLKGWFNTVPGSPAFLAWTQNNLFWPVSYCRWLYCQRDHTFNFRLHILIFCALQVLSFREIVKSPVFSYRLRPL